MNNFVNANTLLDVSIELFKENTPAKYIEKEFLPNSPTRIPAYAETCVKDAQRNYYKALKEFKVTIALNPTTQLDKGDLTKQDLAAIRPIFASEYLKNAGISNTEENVKKIEKLVPIDFENVEIHTQQTGYFGHSEIIVNPNVPERLSTESPQRRKLNDSCNSIRRGLKTAWETVENRFPKEIPQPISTPYRTKTKVSSRKAELLNSPQYDRCPSTLPTKKRGNTLKIQTKTPFISNWFLLLPKEIARFYVQSFVDTFNFEEYLQRKNISDCVDFILTGPCSRLVYHTTKYLHAIFVRQTDDLSNYVRTRVIWTTLNKICKDDFTIRYMDITLLAIKSSVYAIFLSKKPDDSVTSNQEMKETLLEAIDELFDPLHLYYRYQNNFLPTSPQKSPMRMPGLQRYCPDLTKLINMKVLSKEDEKFARIIFDVDPIKSLRTMMAKEDWGDISADLTALNQQLNEINQVEQLIQLDLEEINKTIPRKPPKWIKKKIDPKRSPVDVRRPFK